MKGIVTNLAIINLHFVCVSSLSSFFILEDFKSCIFFADTNTRGSLCANFGSVIDLHADAQPYGSSTASSFFVKGGSADYYLYLNTLW